MDISTDFVSLFVLQGCITDPTKSFFFSSFSLAECTKTEAITEDVLYKKVFQKFEVSDNLGNLKLKHCQKISWIGLDI